jgi:ClpP class serine protease
VYSGDAALRLGLIDRLGGFASALARARQLGRVSADAPVVVVPGRPGGLLDYVLGNVRAAGDETPVHELIPADMKAGFARALTLEHLGSTAPLALLPYDLGF